MTSHAPELRWIALVAGVLSLVVVLEAALWHYRSGFPLKAQYAPLLAGGLLTTACALVAMRPGELAAAIAIGTGWLAAVTGIIGIGYHHWYGIVKKAGGYRWLLHWLMHAAPPLAPLALTTAGVMTVMAAVGLRGESYVMAVALPRAFFLVVALALVGALLQTALLHYRGAFNTAFMYAPFIAPPLAVVFCFWLATGNPPTLALSLATLTLWLTVLTGIAGIGLHLRGLERQMGGLFVGMATLLQGPPPLAPAFYAAVAAVGLLATRMR